MLEDFSKVDFVQDELGFVRDIVRAITSHSFTSQRFRQYSNLRLKLPNSTRFGTNVILLQRFWRLRKNVKKFLFDEEVEQWLRTKNFDVEVRSDKACVEVDLNGLHQEKKSL